MKTGTMTLQQLGEWLSDRGFGFSCLPNGGALATWTAMVRRGRVAWTGDGNSPAEALDEAVDAYLTSGTPRMRHVPEEEERQIDVSNPRGRATKRYQRRGG